VLSPERISKTFPPASIQRGIIGKDNKAKKIIEHNKIPSPSVIPARVRSLFIFDIKVFILFKYNVSAAKSESEQPIQWLIPNTFLRS
jgi:hypothetical protein